MNDDKPRDKYGRIIETDNTDLDERLQRVLDEAGPHAYGKVTAKHFSRFGQLGKKRPRYAVR